MRRWAREAVGARRNLNLVMQGKDAPNKANDKELQEKAHKQRRVSWAGTNDWWKEFCDSVGPTPWATTGHLREEAAREEGKATFLMQGDAKVAVEAFNGHVFLDAEKGDQNREAATILSMTFKFFVNAWRHEMIPL